MRNIITLFTLSCTFLVLGAVCAGPKGEISPKPTESTPAFKFQSKLGEIFTGKVQGVDLTGLPKKLLYPKSKPLARYGKYERPRWGCSYNLETPDQPEQVLNYYQSVLNDWQVVNRQEEENYYSITYEPADEKEVVEVNVTRKEQKTVIVLCHTYN